jgi:type II secretory pathway component GspD/PulD (secretin)
VALSGSVGVPFSTNDDKDLPEEDRYVTQIVHVKNVKPSELVPILTPYAQVLNNILAIDPSSMLIIRDYSVNVKRMMELIKQIDIVAPLEFESELIPIKYAKAADIASALGNLGGNTSSFGSAASGGTTGARTGGFTPGGAGAGTLGGAATPGTTRALPASTTGSSPWA